MQEPKTSTMTYSAMRAALTSPASGLRFRLRSFLSSLNPSRILTDRALTALGIAIGTLTLFAVMASADGSVTLAEAETAGAFLTGAGLVLLVTYGKKK